MAAFLSQLYVSSIYPSLASVGFLLSTCLVVVLVLFRTWNFPYVAKVLASSANYMICDDHEFVDDLGEAKTERASPAVVVDAVVVVVRCISPNDLNPSQTLCCRRVLSAVTSAPYIPLATTQWCLRQEPTNRGHTHMAHGGYAAARKLPVHYGDAGVRTQGGSSAQSLQSWEQ